MRANRVSVVLDFLLECIHQPRKGTDGHSDREVLARDIADRKCDQGSDRRRLVGPQFERSRSLRTHTCLR
jgi:hypothetical protein